MSSFVRVDPSGAFYFRRRVPSLLRARCGRLEIIRRVVATTPRHAAEEARRLASLFDQAFRLMAVQIDLTLDQAVSLARRWFRDQMAADEQLLTETSPASREVSQALRERNVAKVELARDQLADNDLDQASLVVAGIERAEGISLSADGRERLARLILRGMVSLQELYADRLHGIYRAPNDPMFASDDAGVPPPIRVEPEETATPSPNFLEAAGKMVAEKRAARAWDEKTERQARDTFGLFVEHAGDRPVSSYTRPEIADFRDVVLKLPKMRGKSPALIRKPLGDLVAAVEAGAEPIAPKSIKRHMAYLSQAFAWMVDQGWRSDNPAGKVFRFARTKAANEERVPWSDAQIVSLFASPVWRGRKSAKSRIEAGDVIVRDAWWWWPIIGLHTGARLGEIAQLRPDDIAEEGGIYYLDIGQSGGRKVKTAASARRVPLHRTLIDLGLVGHRDRMKEEDRKTLWPDMPPARYGDQQGGAFTRNFGGMVRSLGIVGPTFHSFRHVVATKLQNLGTPERTIAAILGHKLGGMGSRYGDRFQLDVLADAINRLTYPVDFVALPPEAARRQ